MKEGFKSNPSSHLPSQLLLSPLKEKNVELFFFFPPFGQINKMFGTVVVGVGIAGLARIRDLMNPMPSSPSEHLKLFGFVSRLEISS